MTRCNCPSDTHDIVCELSAINFNKKNFVIAAINAVRVALIQYQELLDMGYSSEEAGERIRDETEESATCFVGIGSCGDEGCKHA